jgi:hypothetical protein
MMGRFIFLLAFLVQLITGQQVLVRDAVGLVIFDRELDGKASQCMGFFDVKHDPLVAFPLEMVRGVMYLPDNGVM